MKSLAGTLVLLTAFSPTPADIEPTSKPGDTLRAHLKRAGLASEFRVISARRMELPSLEDFADYGFVADAARTVVRPVWILGSTGEVTSLTEVQRMQAERRRELFGKLSPRLAESISFAEDASEPVRVRIWTTPPRDEIARPMRFESAEEVVAFRKALREQRAPRISAIHVPVLQAIEQLGGTNTLSFSSPPVVIATISASNLAALELLDEVEQIDFVVGEGVVSITTSERTIDSAGAPAKDGSNLGGGLGLGQEFDDADDSEALEQYTLSNFFGTGVRVGIWEASDQNCGIWKESSTVPEGFSEWSGYTSKSGPADTCAVLDGFECPCGGQNLGTGICRSGRCTKKHATQVASKIGAFKNGDVRNASRLHLFYAAQGSLESRLDWLDAQAITVANDSEALLLGGNPISNEEWGETVNHVVRTDYITVTKSAGNHPYPWTDCYDNGICVGIYTGPEDAWKEDPLNESGVYLLDPDPVYEEHPTRPDAEKPDVLGNPASPIVTPDDTGDGWGLSGGTSLAAPSVAGMVALLHEESPTAAGWPELTRPMIMVSAIAHNVTGASLSRNGPFDATDESDGAGVPTASTLRAIVQNGTWTTLSLDPTDFDGFNRYTPPGAQVTLAPGETARAALSWNFCVEAGSNKKSASFMLELRDSTTGVLRDSSGSAWNSVEMIQYTNHTNASQTMTLTIHVTDFDTCNGVEHEWAAMAWTKSPLPLGPSRIFPVTKTNDTNDGTCNSDCSLREAVRWANLAPGRDAIELEADTYDLQIPGTLENFAVTGDLDINEDLIVKGAGTQSLTAINGNQLDRIFHVRDAAHLELEGMILLNGSIPSFEGGAIAVSSGDLSLTDVVLSTNQSIRGGAIWNNGGSVLMKDVVIQYNDATDGGGVFNDGGTLVATDTMFLLNDANNGGGVYSGGGGAVILDRSLLQSNHADNKGGGLVAQAQVFARNSTISGNDAAVEGGGAWVAFGQQFWSDYTTIANNAAPSGDAIWAQGDLTLTGSLVDGSCFASGGITADRSMEGPGNTCGLTGTNNANSVPDLGLAALTNVGATRVHPLKVTSPAIDAFPYSESCPTVDQTQFPRPWDGGGDPAARCDAGAYEAYCILLRFTSPTQMIWDALPFLGCFEIYRGFLHDLTDTDDDGVADGGYGDCQGDGHSSFTTSGTPPPGTGWYYMALSSGSPIAPASCGAPRSPTTACVGTCDLE